jgi:hypothetical protein
MSFGSFWGTDPNDPNTYEKILSRYLEGGAAGQMNLNDVLQNGNNAGNIGISNLNITDAVEVQTGLLAQGNFAALRVGDAGDNIQILGATAKGSILVGDGANTQSLGVGANGLVLTANSGTATGLEWAAGGGAAGVASVAAGVNENITITGTAVNPIVGVSNPLNGVLNIGTQNITGTTGDIILTNAPNQTTLAEGGLTAVDTAVGTTITSVAKTGLTTSTATDSMSATPTGLSKTVGATALTLSSTTAPIQLTPDAGKNCAVNISGVGNFQVNQTSIGGASQPATSVINTNGSANAVHLDLYKNSPSPANNDGIAGVSYHANNAAGTKVEYARIQADQRDITAGSENGSISVLTCVNSATPTEFFRFNGSGLSVGTNDLYKQLDTRGNNITTTAGNINIYNDQVAAGVIALTNVAPNGGISINKSGTAGGNLFINSGTSTVISSSVNTVLSGGAGVVVQQNASTQPRLITEIANVNYYPDYVYDNQNVSTPNSIPAPAIQGQRLTLINKGVSPSLDWIARGITGVNPAGVYATYSASSGLIWVARTDFNEVQVWDSTFSTQQGSVVLGGSGDQRAFCFWEESGYMFIGGSFTSVNGNATQQGGLTRVNTSAPFTEDPIYDGAGGINSVNIAGSGYGIYTITTFGGTMYCGGNFQQFSNGSSANNIFALSSYTAGSGSQTYDWMNGGVNSAVQTLLGAGSYLFIGGDFTNVYTGTSPVSYQHLVSWTSGVYDFVAGNAWNGSVNTLQFVNSGSLVFVGGAFTITSQSYSCYIDYLSPNSSAQDTTLSISNPLTRGSTFYNGNTYVSTVANGIYYLNYPTWVYDDDAINGYTPRFIGNLNGQLNVAYQDTPDYYQRTSLTQNGVWTLSSGNFKFNGLLYTTFTMGIRDQAQQFLGDLTGGTPIWRQIANTPYGSFS